MGQEDPRRFHVGMLFKDEQGEWHLTHNARHVGHARTEKLTDAMADPHHGVHVGTKRPIAEDPNGRNPDLLTRHGFGHLATAV